MPIRAAGLLLLSSLILFAGQQSHAQTENPGNKDLFFPVRDFCTFHMGFPEDPAVISLDESTQTVSATKIFDLERSLRVRTTCKKRAALKKDQLLASALKADLERLAEDRNVRIVKAHINRSRPDKTLVVSVTGYEKEFPAGGITTYQYWLDDMSLFLLEVESKGKESDEKLRLTVDILQSMRPVVAPKTLAP